MSFLQCGDAVHYYRSRAGTRREPLLVFINGLGTDQRIWDGVLAALPAPLSALCYDLRGQGLSELGQGHYDVGRLSLDLELLLERLGAASVLPIGFSLGGLVAQQFAVAHPARVRGLVLCATSARIGNADIWRQRAEQVQRGGLASVSAGVIERWFSAAFRELQPQVVRGYRTLLERSDAASYLAALALLGETDLSAGLAQLSVPALVVAGGADLATPPDQLRQFAERISGARFRLLAGAGHLLSVEQPEALARCISDFVEGLDLV